MREMVTESSGGLLKYLSNNFVFRKPMLCFELSKEIVLEVGSEVFTEDVGVNIKILDAVLVDCFCVDMWENFIYKCMNNLYQHHIHQSV